MLSSRYKVNQTGFTVPFSGPTVVYLSSMYLRNSFFVWSCWNLPL